MTIISKKMYLIMSYAGSPLNCTSLVGSEDDVCCSLWNVFTFLYTPERCDRKNTHPPKYCGVRLEGGEEKGGKSPEEKERTATTSS